MIESVQVDSKQFCVAKYVLLSLVLVFCQDHSKVDFDLFELSEISAAHVNCEATGIILIMTITRTWQLEVISNGGTVSSHIAIRHRLFYLSSIITLLVDLCLFTCSSAPVLENGFLKGICWGERFTSYSDKNFKI